MTFTTHIISYSDLHEWNGKGFWIPILFFVISLVSVKKLRACTNKIFMHENMIKIVAFVWSKEGATKCENISGRLIDESALAHLFLFNSTFTSLIELGHLMQYYSMNMIAWGQHHWLFLWLAIFWSVAISWIKIAFFNQWCRWWLKWTST